MIQLRIESILESRGLSIYWLAKKTSIDYPILWKLVHRRMRGFPFEYIDRICEALGCQPGDLMIWVADSVELPSDREEGRSSKRRSGSKKARG